MLGIIYIFVCLFTGCAICTIASPKLKHLTAKAYNRSEIFLSPYFVLLPAWFLSGTLCVTWTTYFVAYFFGESETPLKYANAIVMPLFLILSSLCFILKRSKSKTNTVFLTTDFRSQNSSIPWTDMVFLFLVTLLAASLMWTTFFISKDQLYVGPSVFSDFSPHLGMIRSFSKGNNFPTQYSHFAGQDIKYHFMYQFFIGNLEYLGMRLDYAFNIASIFSFISAFLLLFVLAVKISGKRSVGYLACLFFAFRSSESLFTYLSELPKGTNILQALGSNRDFIGYTTHEEWGLWNLNVYCNQRHLAFSIAVILLVIMVFLPHLYAMFETIKEEKRFFQTIFLTKKGWAVQDLRLAIVTGVFLGSIAFWNGAALIGAFTVLFILAICSERRLEFLITAVTAAGLSMMQAKFFISGSAVSTKLYFGFLAENPTLFGVMDYLKRLLGILPVILIAAFLAGNTVRKYLMVAFLAPMILAFTLSLTPDVTVNHKYIMIAIMLLGILAADYLVQLFEEKKIWITLVGILITISLTATGFYDYTTVLRKNQSSFAFVFDLNDTLSSWIQENSNSKDIFLTSNYALNRVVLGGAMLYQGWTYYAWSAGYDTMARDVQVKLMYEADSKEALKSLVKMNHIRYIIVDNDNRISKEYDMNEENIKNTYTSVYQDGEGEWTTTVYDTQKEK